MNALPTLQSAVPIRLVTINKLDALLGRTVNWDRLRALLVKMEELNVVNLRRILVLYTMCSAIDSKLIRLVIRHVRTVLMEVWTAVTHSERLVETKVFSATVERIGMRLRLVEMTQLLVTTVRTMDPRAVM
jgi:hypothetical protein